METYNGWKNRQTWNVSLWLNNTEWMYREAVHFMRQVYTGKAPYISFITWLGLVGERTGDNIKWASNALDYKALNEMMEELKGDE